jgi:hypothetical protein
MSWVRLDDNFADHPKVIGLSDSAFRLYVEALCYANRYLTDGAIPYVAFTNMHSPNGDQELIDSGLWEFDTENNCFLIRSYTEYQPTKEKVSVKREQARERVKQFREKKRAHSENGETQMKRESYPSPTQPNPTQPNPTTSTSTEVSDETSIVVAPRVNSARVAVENISNKLAEARANGINAWNLSRLVEDEWDKLHDSNDVGGCIALTVWYVSELQSRKLNSSEIGRIGQMTKRFGRISLLAIDQAASKELDDLVSYAMRVAQNLYKEKAGK